MIAKSAGRPRGRPRRYAALEALKVNPPLNGGKRPHYVNGIGLLHGVRDITAYVKIKLSPKGSREMKLGLLSSFSFDQLDQIRRDLQGRADRGEPLHDVAPPTFVQHAADWLERKRPLVRGYSTIKGHVSGHLNPTFGHYILNEIAVADVDRWIAQQRGSGLKPATVNRQLSTLNSILNDAVRAGLISKNPATLANRVRGAAPRLKFLSFEQLDHVLCVARAMEQEEEGLAAKLPFQKRGWLRDFIVWALHSGMRRQEILNLSLTDLVTINGVTSVLIHTSKSGKPRAIPATTEMQCIYKRQKDRDRIHDDNRLFTVSLTTVKRKLTALWKATGLGDVRLHDLRRTYATILCDQNIDMRTVAGRLGHSDTKMLMTTYAVYHESRSGTNKLDEAFSRFS